MGMEEFENHLGLEPVDGFCLLLVDGLGHEQLLAHAEVAPFLAGLASEREPLTAPFPSTTAASLGSLGTGLPPGGHGLVGYTFAVPSHDRPMNALLWELYGIGPHVDLRASFDPQAFQPSPTALERAEARGSTVTRIGPPPHEGSGFTESVLRGGRYVGAYWPDDVRREIATALGQARPTVWAYHPDLDTAGHSTGAGSDEWLARLRAADVLARDVASDLPPRTALVVTGDHGMVTVDRDERVFVEDHPGLCEGVRMVAGESRARHVYARPGAAADVLAAWGSALGDRMWVASKEGAIARGWFGPTVSEWVEPRIGDVVAAARTPMGVFQRSVDPLQAQLVGHHGSMTPAEQLVPFIVARS
jgi:hypothetical protein